MKQLIICLIIVITIITGCRYKEGPMLNFRSVEKRLTGTWQIIELTSDGIDSLQYYNDSCGSVMILRFPYDDDSRIYFERGKKGFSGYITLTKNKTVMEVYIDDNFPATYWHLGPIGSSKVKSYWKILRLTKNDFKISTDYNGKNYHISFKK